MVTKLQHSPTASLDVRAVVQFFGGRQALVNDLKAFEIVELDVTAIDKWQQRNKIPADRKEDLMTLARLKGTKFSFTRFRPKAAKKKAA